MNRVANRMSTKEYKALQDAPAARPSKFRSKPVEIDGIRFDSTHEGDVYTRLKLMERAGQIRNLSRQVPYGIEIKEFD